MTASPARIVDSREEAAELVRQGTNVVLVLAPNAAEMTRPTDGPGRLAIMVGLIDDPAVMAAALEMAAELF
jgi:hypothetical protein